MKRRVTVPTCYLLLFACATEACGPLGAVSGGAIRTRGAVQVIVQSK